MIPMCIYHASCDDGFAAAWAVRHALGNDVEFIAAQYQNAPPDVAGRDVIMVDFSYKRAVLMEMAQTANSILIIDHHKTAAEDLAGFPSSIEISGEKIAAIFDMERSGAGMAWDHFHPGVARPMFINYIEDRDLWHKRLPGVDDFTAALRSYPMDFETWDLYANDPIGVSRLIDEGRGINRYIGGRVKTLVESAYRTNIGGVPCWLVNAPGYLASEVAGELSKGALPMGAIFFQVGASEWVYSLRSTTDFDVSEVAKKFGGGGHKQASGFKSDKLVHLVA